MNKIFEKIKRLFSLPTITPSNQLTIAARIRLVVILLIFILSYFLLFTIDVITAKIILTFNLLIIANWLLYKTN
jgi:hypothetical protein